MEKIKLIHNPTAGNGAYDKDELIAIIEAAGYECDYSSSKKDGWKEICDGTDMIVIAGGDGTVRKVAKAFLKNEKMDNQLPLGLLNLGTANNLLRTLRIKGEPGELIETYKKDRVKKFDVGIVKGLEDHEFFLESCGFGVFPQLMNEMRKADVHDVDAALQVMESIVETIKPFQCSIVTDNQEIEGKFLLVEVMNTAWMGPSLHMNTLSDPGDGKLEIVLIKDDQREEFLQFIRGKLADGSGAFSHHPVQCEHASISTDFRYFHADDELIKLKGENLIKVNTKPQFLQFMIN